MAAGPQMWPNANSRTVRRQQSVRGPGNIAGLAVRGRKVVARARRMALKGKAKKR